MSKIKLINFKDINFSSKPNLKYRENIVQDFQRDYWIFDNYDIFYLHDKTNENKFELFIAYGCSADDDINILKISDKKLIKKLKGHKETVDIVQHFYNDINKKQYLLSADYSKLVLVWDITNNYIPIIKIITKYTKYIYSFMIIFEMNYIITSTEGTSDEDYSRIYSLTNGKRIANIENSNKNETLCLLKWYHNKKYYLIELCYQNILIYDLSNRKLYKNLTENSNLSKYYYSGFVTSDNKYLYACNNKGKIKIYNLITTTLVYSIKIDNSYFFKILLWNSDISNQIVKDIQNKKIENYILISDKRRKGFFCIKISLDRTIKDNKENDTNFNYQINSLYKNKEQIKCLKKIIHPVYRECLLTSGDDPNIYLWTNSNKF